jgi:hypothetical protein
MSHPGVVPPSSIHIRGLSDLQQSAPRLTERSVIVAGNKSVPLTWGVGGPRVGSATLDENGFIVAEVEDERVQRLLFGETSALSIHTPNARPGTAIEGSFSG